MPECAHKWIFGHHAPWSLMPSSLWGMGQKTMVLIPIPVLPPQMVQERHEEMEQVYAGLSPSSHTGDHARPRTLASKTLYYERLGTTDL